MTPLEEAVVAQDLAIERLTPAIASAVQSASRGVGSPTVVVETSAELATRAIVAGVIAALLRQTPPALVPSSAITQKLVEDIAPSVADTVWKAARSVAERLKEPLELGATMFDQRERERNLVKLAAREVGTRTTALSVLEGADALELPYKVWVTRGDARVRPSHRALHGKVVEIEKPFKSWLTGATLSYPGDMSAPIGETANCRCFMWAATEKASVEQALAPGDLDRAFALAASLERASLE